MNAALEPLLDSRTDLDILGALWHELDPTQPILDYRTAFALMAAEESWLQGLTPESLGLTGKRLSFPGAGPVPPTPGIVPIDTPDYALPLWRK